MGDQSDLPSLQSLVLASKALTGDYSDDRKMSREEPYNYKNTMVMKSGCGEKDGGVDLPSLTAIKGGEWIFGYMGSVVLQSRRMECGRCRCFGADSGGNRIGFGLFQVYHIY